MPSLLGKKKEIWQRRDVLFLFWQNGGDTPAELLLPYSASAVKIAR